jgi:hypothetical protein
MFGTRLAFGGDQSRDLLALARPGLAISGDVGRECFVLFYCLSATPTSPTVSKAEQDRKPRRNGHSSRVAMAQSENERNGKLNNCIMREAEDKIDKEVQDLRQAYWDIKHNRAAGEPNWRPLIVVVAEV